MYTASVHAGICTFSLLSESPDSHVPWSRSHWMQLLPKSLRRVGAVSPTGEPRHFCRDSEALTDDKMQDSTVIKYSQPVDLNELL